MENAIRKAPTHAGNRVELFDVLCLAGDFARAATILDTVTQFDKDSQLFTSVYAGVLRSEAQRQAFFGGKERPLIVGEPLPFIAPLLEAFRLEAEGNGAAAAELRADAINGSPDVAGVCELGEFSNILDADCRFGPCIELIQDNRYWLAPICRLAKLEVREPVNHHDLVWARARFTWATGGISDGFLPVRYPGSERSTEAALRLAAETHVLSDDEGLRVLAGQRLLATTAGELPLLQAREITFRA